MSMLVTKMFNREQQGQEVRFPSEIKVHVNITHVRGEPNQRTREIHSLQ
uniref:Uncharacterized protein n=1 Tax=Rhizophora mucronata TaxID=61149 RepID=A0A2P2K768_RHIMU